jgi:hypothetical protein
MNNNQKMLLGVAVVGVAAYYYWKSQQPQPAAKFVGANGIFAGRPNQRIFAGANGKYGNLIPQASCMCHTGETKVGPKGDMVYTCKNGNTSFKTGGPCGGAK